MGFAAHGFGSKSMEYPGPLRILKNETLSADESKVEERFAAVIQEHLEEIITDYHARFDNVIDTDRAREFSQDYCASIESRARFSRASYNPAKALADEIYRRKIANGFEKRPARIFFTSGGTGVGKTTALEFLKEEEDPEQKYDLLVDGTLSDHPAARSKIAEALSLGHEVAIVHVHREFAETVRMVINRAIHMGRAVTLDNIAVTHFRSAETIVKLAKEFGNRIWIRVIENSSDHPTKFISLVDLADKQTGSVDQLRELAQTVFNEFDGLKADHPEIYEALLQKGSRR